MQRYLVDDIVQGHNGIIRMNSYRLTLGPDLASLAYLPKGKSHGGSNE
jgi:hypothetical protein